MHQATASPIAAEALRRIGELYAAEDRIRGRSAELRRMMRQELARPLVGSLKAWLEAELHRVAPRSGLADAIRYALVRWEALCRSLDDGRVELDTNTVERAIRPIATKRSLCIPSSSVCKHWKCIRVGNATRATFSGHRRFDRRQREIIGTDLIRRSGNDLFSGKDARFNEAAYRVVGNA